MEKEKKITCKWTQRNIQRLHKWLNIDSHWNGLFSRNGKVIGYKQANKGQKITFVFYRKG